MDFNKVRFELQKLLSGKFDLASKTCLIEEKIFGYEITLYSLWDGENLVHLPLCQTKKQNEFNLNTSGLASICPVELDKDPKKNLETYKLKLKKMLVNENIKTPFVFCSNLMINENDIFVLGCNVSFGECDIETLLNFISNDWLEIFFNCTTKSLFNLNISTRNAFQMTSVALYSKGYPLKTRKNLTLKNIEKIDDTIEVYFSNIIKKDGLYLSLGDSILTVVSNDKSNIYRYLNRICFEDKAFETKVQLNLGK
jgi:phosphoribosylamine-glycine ligase